MGSLMSGWDTKSMDAKEVYRRSTSSMTRGEVERFWKARNNSIDRHLEDAQKDASIARSISVPESGVAGGSFTGSPPVTPTSLSPTSPVSSDLMSLAASDRVGWWQRSTWAFLNEPPLMEDRGNRYAAQYDSRASLSDLHTNGTTNGNGHTLERRNTKA